MIKRLFLLCIFASSLVYHSVRSYGFRWRPRHLANGTSSATDTIQSNNDSSTDDDTQEYYYYYGNYDPSRPGKGNPDCNQVENWTGTGPPPCRSGNNAYDNTTPPPPPGADPGYNNTEGNASLLDPNDVTIDVLVGFPPDRPSASRIVTYLVTLYLQDLLPTMLFQKKLSTTTTTATGTTTWILTHRFTLATLEQENTYAWWWRYNITFSCYDASDEQPVTDIATLQQIQAQLAVAVAQGLITGTLQTFVWNHGYELDSPPLLVAVKIPPVDAPANFQGTVNSPSNTTVTTIQEPTYAKPIDQKNWDWQRYTGLGLFIVTFGGVLLLMQIAAVRQRQLRKKEYWSNLNTLQGVEDVLQTGWKVKGNRMEVFEKKKVGYRDDDSMLIGGYEGAGVTVGTTITVTQSEATPEGPLARSDVSPVVAHHDQGSEQ